MAVYVLASIVHDCTIFLAFWKSRANKQSLFLIHFVTLVLLPHTIFVDSSISEMRKMKQLSQVIVDSSWLELPSIGAVLLPDMDHCLYIGP
jgi:hypothetical protein